ncbi:hypothetical protein ASPZODRAFT_11578 [Penicilliopsis zonata CBS 506.65]|uniref:Zn(2)-C6 fungal-type domain-containing protein n=1 Tax=Penicilliopsis zonata CBS 506.65 TaxID=1073090 RepID=A0A1L9SUI4_9EURO|nr:hypothetical protein ASPZODRAFT_11578 [Penicilliopsis zonata CBS 506.65]OJJ50723.1 hypothetical protein ASPZODRAFT_11578 [Penicilliopsis zonata CBS 506.65]
MLAHSPPKPRKRIILACNGCRAKRTKCDGRQPRCGGCSYREEECQYTDSESKRKRPSNAYISALEARVECLERRLAASEGRGKTNSDSGQRAAQEPKMDDLTEAFGCFTLGDAGELRFFGASSNFSLIQNHSLKVASSTEARLRGLAAARQTPGYFDPPAELRDHLLGLFWRWQNSWQYLVPRELFLRDLYVDHSGRYCTPLLLMAILALASRYSSRPEVRRDIGDANTAGAAFASQAKTMLDYEYEAPTTTTVQATALLGLYWASIDNEGLGFMYIGMASRMAMNLGLHSDCSHSVSRNLVSRQDVEERNIVFWGVYLLDKLYCLGMGRPASIQEYNITTAKPTAENYPLLPLSDEQTVLSTPFPTSHITENAVATCELLIITSEVIDQLYAQRSEWTDREREDRVMETQLRATRFHDRLPKSLRISDSSLQPSRPYVYQLHLQYHHSVILLHRPFLNPFSPSSQSIEYDPDGKDIHSRSCKAAAMKTSQILRIYMNNFTKRYFPISAVHPTFTAAIILLLDLKIKKEKETMHSLCICMKALYGMNINWDWANRSIRAIRSLAAQWEVDLFVLDLERDIDEESRRQYERYPGNS